MDEDIVERPEVSFPRDAEGVMEFSIARHGQFKGDRISVGSVGMPIHFAIVQGANPGARSIYCASISDRRPYRLVASGYCSLKEGREWCTENALTLADVFTLGGEFKVATLTGKFGRRKEILSDEDEELQELERKVKQLEAKLAELQAKRG